MKRAVVLLSGGIDSATTLAIAIAEGYQTYALSFDYGQRHCIETEATQRVANSLGAKEHRIAKIDLRVFGGSALTDDVDVPKQRAENCAVTIASRGAQAFTKSSRIRFVTASLNSRSLR